MTLAFSLTVSSLFSQTPQGFNYQAVVRGINGNPLPNQNTGFKFSILQGSASGSLVYSETFDLNTNAQGVVSLVIGTGTVQAGNFNDINWMDGPYFLKVETDPAGGTAYSLVETRQIQSVPLAMYSQKSTAISGGKLIINGDETQDPEQALFEVKRNDGQTVFAVYPDGTRVYVEDIPGKGSKGGFAVGGFTPGKGLTNEYMRVTPDSVRVYIDETIAKGSKGGFAVGGFSPGKADPIDLLHLTKENYFIGHESGANITRGRFNSFFGFNAGRSNTSGNNNVFLGYKSGFSNITADNNVFLGNESGYNTTDGFGNVYIGYYAGHENKAGKGNSFVGYEAGYNNNADYNAFYGFNSGKYNTTGSYNLYMGNYAGHGNTSSGGTGSYNVFLGNYSGQGVSSGSYNCLIGFHSGRAFSTGTGNVFLGYRAGYMNDTASYNVFIGKESGYSNKGTFNTYLGYNSGRANVSGSRNAFIGYMAGLANTTGSDNVFIGNEAGKSNQDGLYNTFVGYQSGYSNTGGTSWDGDYNTFIGFQAGYNNTSGHRNIAIGYRAGFGYTTNRYNICIGEETGSALAEGQANVIIGTYAGEALSSGEGNVILGLDAGWMTTSGSDNVMIGLGAGRASNANRGVFLGRYAGYSEAGNDKLVIENSYTGSDNNNNALIYGDFSNDYLRINGRLFQSANYEYGWAGSFFNDGGNTYRYGLRVQAGTDDGSGTNFMYVVYNGAGGYEGGLLLQDGSLNLVQYSDKRSKTNIQKTELNALDILKRMEVVDFSYINTPNAKHTGYIAQDVKELLPSMVIYNEKDDAYGIAPMVLIPIMHKAIQDQQKMIEELKAEIEALKNK